MWKTPERTWSVISFRIQNEEKVLSSHKLQKPRIAERPIKNWRFYSKHNTINRTVSFVISGGLKFKTVSIRLNEQSIDEKKPTRTTENNGHENADVKREYREHENESQKNLYPIDEEAE